MSKTVTYLKSIARKNNLVRRYYVRKRRITSLASISVPNRLIFEPTNICNYSCYKCLYPDMKRTKGIVDITKFKIFLATWKETYGDFDSIEFTGGGEVLVANNFAELVDLVATVMPSTLLKTTTNLALFDKDLARTLIQSGLKQWQISLDSIDNAEYTKIVGNSKINVSTIIENIKSLWNLFKENDSEKNKLIIVSHRPYDGQYHDKMNEIYDAVKLYCHEMTKSPYQSLNSRIDDASFTLSEDKFYKKRYQLPCEYLWTDLVVPLCQDSCRLLSVILC